MEYYSCLQVEAGSQDFKDDINVDRPPGDPAVATSFPT